MAESIFQNKVKTPWKGTSLKENDEVINQVLDAYLAGINKGYHEAKSIEQEILKNAFLENFKKATSTASDTAIYIAKTFAIDIKGLFLNIENKSSFIVAIILPFDFYLSKNRRKLTTFLIDQEEKNNTTTFNLSFTILPNKKTLNLDKLMVDGYTLRHEQYE